MEKRLWTREELIVAFNLYLKIEFGKTHSRNPQVIELAKTINRSPASIVMRLGNFASIDPYHQNRGVGGLKNGMNQVKPIWNEFFSNKEELIFLSEKILAEKQNTSIENKYQDILFDLKNLKGEEVIRQVKTRVNQSVFRQMVLTNYDSKCAITGIDIPELLLASHILPWSKNEDERLNPENGICLSALYDKAFDKGLIGISQNYEVQVSPIIKKETFFYQTHFGTIENKRIIEPQKYFPNKDFLDYHQKNIFKK